MKRSKSYREAAEQIDRDKLYSPAEAVSLAKSSPVTKFDPTVEVALRLGVDPRKQDQMVRGTVNLPNGTGKTARVLVFATGERAEEARAAGADFVGSDDLIERIQGGFLDFDAVVATPDLMGKVGRITAAQVRDIAQTKMPDLNATTIEAAEKIIAGTARSMGIKVEN